MVFSIYLPKIVNKKWGRVSIAEKVAKNWKKMLKSIDKLKIIYIK